MPELPEVHTVVEGLKSVILGKTIESCYLTDKHFRGAKLLFNPNDLLGLTVKSCKRRAKYILIGFTNNSTLLLHLGMSGKALAASSFKESIHNHLIIKFTDLFYLIFNDPRRFGMIKLIGADGLADEPLLVSLGLEPLEKEFTARALHDFCLDSKSPIKSLLMNNKFIVGVGNIYASEALFDAGIMPNRPANTLSYNEAIILHKAIIKVLQLAISSGGSTLRDYADSRGQSGNFQHYFNVYGKNGLGCVKCSDLVKKIVIGNRSTFYCSTCQI